MSNEVAYTPDPRQPPGYTVPSRGYGALKLSGGTMTGPLTVPSLTISGSIANILQLTRQAADTQGVTIQTTKRGKLVDVNGAILLDNGIFQIRAMGWNGSASIDGGRMQINAAENWTGSINSVYFRFIAPFLGASAPQQELFRVQPLVAGSAIQLMATQVVTVRQTGWGVPTGTPTRTTFDTAAVTLPQLAERVKALVDDLTTHGLIGP